MQQLQDETSFEEEMKKKKTRAKRNSACHHCRRNHISCDGQRPCANCVKKQRQCFDYDAKLLKSKLKAAKPTSTSMPTPTKPTTTPPSPSQKSSVSIDEFDKVASELAVARNKMKEMEEKIRLLEQQNQDLTSVVIQTKSDRDEPEDSSTADTGTDLVPRVEFGVNLWSIPLEIQKPAVVFDTTTFYTIGCNNVFARTCGYDLSRLRNNFDIFELIPERNREMWKLVVKWFVTARVHHFVGNAIIRFGNGKERSIRVTSRIGRSHIWVELEELDYFTDESMVNDVYVEPSFKVPYSPSVLCTTPAKSFARLLDVLKNFYHKATYSDQYEDQEKIINGVWNDFQDYLPHNAQKLGSSSTVVNQTTVQPNTQPIMYTRDPQIEPSYQLFSSNQCGTYTANRYTFPGSSMNENKQNLVFEDVSADIEPQISSSSTSTTTNHQTQLIIEMLDDYCIRKQEKEHSNTDSYQFL